jgi:hypothetical protein
MNRILIIDDLKSFLWAEQNAYNHVTYARTLADGLALVQKTNFEEIWLDHDLGGEDTIRPIVRWLEEHPPSSTEIIRIISNNPVGQQYIFQALSRFSWSILQLENGKWRNITPFPI